MSLQESYLITFLGCAGGAETMGDQVAGAGGILFTFEGTQLHLDPGPGSGILAARAKVNLRATNVLLVSSNLLHACNDVNLMIDAMTYSGFDKTGLLLCAKSVVERTEHERPYVTKFHKKAVQKYVGLSVPEEVKINDLVIQTLPCHCPDDPTAVGFKIRTKEFILVYSGDTIYDDTVVDSYRGAQILILQHRYPFALDATHRTKALASEDVVRIIEKVRPSFVILTGFGTKLMLANPLYEAREIQRLTNVPVLAAREGLALAPISLLHTLQQNQQLW